MLYTSSLSASIFTLPDNCCELKPKHVVQHTIRHCKSAAVIECLSFFLGNLYITKKFHTGKSYSRNSVNERTPNQIKQKILGQTSKTDIIEIG
jgi:hypothetical protein